MQHDLTTGSIPGRLLGMAAFIGLGLLFQTLYFLVDLYFVAGLGPASIAGVSLAGTLFFLVMAAAQMVGVGSLSLIARAAGARQTDRIEGVFRQSMLLSWGLGVLTLGLGYGLAHPAMGLLAADRTTIERGTAYLYGFLPALAFMFPTSAMGSALRALGVVRPAMLVQTGTVVLNALLAPVLIAGVGTHWPLGTFGAGLASSVAGIVGFVATTWLFGRVQTLVRRPLSPRAPDFGIWAGIVGIGLPSAAEFLLMFVTSSVVYGVIRHFGADAQAGYGVGARVMQSIFLPAMAIAFAVAPVAGQNLGAGRPDRVRETIRTAAILSSILMLVLTLLCHLAPETLIGLFTHDPAVVGIAAGFLSIVSLNFVATGLIFTASGAFQAFGDTRPALVGSVSRLVVFALPALWLARQPWVRLEHVWWLSATSVLVHVGLALLMLRGEMRRKLGPPIVAGR